HPMKRLLVGAVAAALLFLTTTVAVKADKSGLPPVPPAAAVQAQAEANKLVVVALSDLGAEAELGPGTYQAALHMKSSLQQLNAPPGVGPRIEVHVVPPKQCTPKGVIEFLRSLPVGPNDALLFYANCHGCWDPQRGKGGYFLALGNPGRLVPITTI